MNKSITVIFTCFNRKESTINAIKQIVEQNKNVAFNFIIVDDNSSDGTPEAIRELPYECEIINGTGNLFWCGGMRKGIERYFDKNDNRDCLLVNDDVSFFERSIEKMLLRKDDRDDYVIVGATCDDEGKFTYGLKKKQKWYQKNMTKPILPGKEEIIGETCNANCVLIPSHILYEIGNMDEKYTHSWGDYDYGYMMTKAGYKLISSDEYIGICNSNSIEGTWADKSLPIKERLRKKESPKGSPRKEFWHFVKKNYGIWDAIWYSSIAYIKIFLRH